MKMDAETYLGDGVYASFDGYQIWLRVERDGRHERIALEPETYASLVDYVANLRARMAALKDTP